MQSNIIRDSILENPHSLDTAIIIEELLTDLKNVYHYEGHSPLSMLLRSTALNCVNFILSIRRSAERRWLLSWRPDWKYQKRSRLNLQTHAKPIVIGAEQRRKGKMSLEELKNKTYSFKREKVRKLFNEVTRLC